MTFVFYIKPEAQAVVVCFGFSTPYCTLTMSAQDVKERTLYEQRRRKNVIRESREYRVMERWLLKMYPVVANEFKLFHTKLQKQNPYKRDLTTTEDFHRFMRLGDGTLRVFCSLALRWGVYVILYYVFRDRALFFESTDVCTT